VFVTEVFFHPHSIKADCTIKGGICQGKNHCSLIPYAKDLQVMNKTEIKRIGDYLNEVYEGI